MPGAVDFLVLVALTAAVAAAAFVGGRATASSVDDWYDSLERPPWTPSGAVIGAVWTVLFVLMVAAAWLVWLRAGWPESLVPFALFAFQLALNALWSVLFFGLRAPGLALAEIVLLEAAVVATAVVFAGHSRVAAGLLVPYAAWVAFAGVLNFLIWRANPT